jgi:hypothetical protein
MGYLSFSSRKEISMIRIEGSHFKDETGRTLMLRGVNLSGSAKVPCQPDGATWRLDHFFDHRNVSFVGRPFPLEEADEHLSRLKAWGFTFLRFLITWEAVEHAGPGNYDEEYLDYVFKVVKKAGVYGINVFIDPHQDEWSRFCGGDGAPGWTLEAVGFDMTHFKETGAAIVHATNGDPLPKMIWPTNEYKLAVATMFTLFFGSNDFAPKIQIEGVPVQDYLQQHYIDAVKQVALRLKDLPNVVGYDSLNEPLTGYITHEDLIHTSGAPLIGDSPTALQGWALGDGIPQEVELWKMGIASFVRAGKHRINQAKVRAWKDGTECIWRQHGVWDVDANGNPRLLKPDYFIKVNGKTVDFQQDYLHPFVKRFAAAIQEVDPKTFIFVESAPNKQFLPTKAGEIKNLVYAPHWYDGYVLLKKEYSSFLAAHSTNQTILLGAAAIKKSFAEQFGELVTSARDEMGNIPVVIGETGIPFDMYHKKAYQTGDFSAQIKSLDRTLQAIEANLLNCTLWNYTPDNTNERGDQWNDEDLSLYSRDQRKNPADIHSGGRALEAAVRPYPTTTAGELVKIGFDYQTKTYEMIFRSDPQISAPTEVFVPSYQYPSGCRVAVSDGSYELNSSAQTLIYRHDPSRTEHSLRITPE